MLHGIHGIQSHCMESTAFKWHAFYQAAWNPLHSIMLPGIHCIQSGCILPGCMESTAFNPAAWNPRHSIGMHWALRHGLHCILWMLLAMLHKIHCIQSSCRNPLHSIMLHKSTVFNGVPFIHAAWNQLHSITLHKIHCIQSGCIGPRFMESTAFNRDALGHAA